MNDRKRQHPFFILLTFIAFIRHLIIPAALAFITTSEARQFIPVYWLILAVVAMIVILLLSGFLAWYRFTYRVEDGSLKVEQGVLIKKRRDISRERIQSIDESAGIFHRLFNVVKVTIETAGGQGKPEVVLNSVKKQDAKILRQALSKKDDKQEHETDMPEKEEAKQEMPTQFHLTTKQLLIAGATSGKIGVVMAVIGGLFSQVDKFLPEHFFDTILQDLLQSSIVFIGFLLMAAAVAAWLLAMLGTVLKYGGFTLTVTEDELRIEHGLLEKRQLTIPTKRIQAVRMEEGILRQPFGLLALYLETGGGGGEEDDYSTLLFPLLARKEVRGFLQQVLPNYVCDFEWQPLPKRAARRYLLRATIPEIVIALVVVTFTSWGYLLFALVPVFGFFAYLAYRDAGWAIAGERVLLRFRRLGRTTVIVQRRRVQASEIQQSYFQKRAELASFQVSVISSFAGAHFKVRDLEGRDGEHLLQWYQNA